MQDKTFLNTPPEVSRQFSKSYIHEFVVEFRFPALLEIEHSNPVDIQKAIRKEYPFYEPAVTTTLGPAGSVTENSHVFRTKDKKNAINLKNASFSYSTQSYTSYQDVRKECEYLIERVVPFLESDFFTRVGMRYINLLPMNNDIQALKQRINPDLGKVLSSGVLGTLTQLRMQCGGQIDIDADYVFKCGITEDNQKNDTVSFILDYDYRQLNVTVDQALTVLDKFHEKHFSFFWWSLGSAAKKDLEDV